MLIRTLRGDAGLEPTSSLYQILTKLANKTRSNQQHERNIDYQER